MVIRMSITISGRLRASEIYQAPILYYRYVFEITFHYHIERIYKSNYKMSRQKKLPSNRKETASLHRFKISKMPFVDLTFYIRQIYFLFFFRPNRCNNDRRINSCNCNGNIRPSICNECIAWPSILSNIAYGAYGPKGWHMEIAR